MEKSPYTPNTNSIPKFLTHIQTAGQPAKVTSTYLQSVGLKSSNDRYLIAIFKALNFIDSQGVPTAIWSEYRNKARAKAVLAAAIRDGYHELFATYPDAYRRDHEALRNFFSTHNAKLSEGTLQLVVRTFKVLADHADFEGAPHETGQTVAAAAPSVHPTPKAGAALAERPSININIELHLPATDDATIYDKLFAALRKHLFS